jgi:hypothetical protein
MSQIDKKREQFDFFKDFNPRDLSNLHVFKKLHSVLSDQSYSVKFKKIILKLGIQRLTDLLNELNIKFARYYIKFYISHKYIDPEITWGDIVLMEEGIMKIPLCTYYDNNYKSTYCDYKQNEYVIMKIIEIIEKYIINLDTFGVHYEPKSTGIFSCTDEVKHETALINTISTTCDPTK